MLRQWHPLLLLILGSLACDSSAPPTLGLRDRHFQLHWDHLPEDAFIEKLQAEGSSDSLRVMWWNIEQGRETPRLGAPILSTHLTRIIQSSLEPDLLILGEYVRTAISDTTYDLILSRYSDTAFLPYNECDPTVGIFIASQLSFRSLELEKAHWISEKASNKDTERKNWFARLERHDPIGAAQCSFDKPAIHVSLQWGMKHLSIFPIHLLMPWNLIRAEKTTFHSAWEVLRGKDNPLATQARSIRSKVNLALERSSADSALMIGDFNLPKTYGLVDSISFRDLTLGFTDAFDEGAQHTFPTLSSQLEASTPKLKIDHALTLGEIRAELAEVLQIQGSDHYPIYLRLSSLR